MQIFTDIYTHFFPLTNEVSDRVRARVVIFVVDIARACVFIGIENDAASMRFMWVCVRVCVYVCGFLFDWFS